MNNRVDYLSDKLVNLRGKLKNVEEVVPKESIVNGVSTPAVKPEAAAATLQKIERPTALPIRETVVLPKAQPSAKPASISGATSVGRGHDPADQVG